MKFRKLVWVPIVKNDGWYSRHSEFVRYKIVKIDDRTFVRYIDNIKDQYFVSEHGAKNATQKLWENEIKKRFFVNEEKEKVDEDY